MHTRARSAAAASLAVGLWLAAGCDPDPLSGDGELDAGAPGEGAASQIGAEVTEAVAWDISPPLRVMAGVQPASAEDRPAADGVATLAGPGVSFDGIAYTGLRPPAPSGDIGPNHYVQVVNSRFVVFTRQGTVLAGPFFTNVMWAGFGGACETRNDGQASIRYDRMADRWVVTQPAYAGTGSNLQCIAVSSTGDPLGAYARYAFLQGAFHDHPRMAVWNNGYYFTYTMFGTSVVARVCATDRVRMLAGQAATQQCFDTTTDHRSLVVADYEGGTEPPNGMPAFVLGLGPSGGDVVLWRFHYVWFDPPSSTLDGPISIPVAAYTPMCSGQSACATQPGTTQLLDGLSDRLISQAGWRRFFDRDALVASHAVLAAAGSGGMRWYEFRDPAGITPILHQQGTVAQPASYRWMGAVAMNGDGGIGLGYSVSSSATFPSLVFTGRVESDPLGTMPLAEATLASGTGSQTGSTRWGEWSRMSADPVDDCTFWLTGEYMGTGNQWRTRIATYLLPDCPFDAPPTTSLTAPVEGAIVSGLVNVQADAADDVGVTQVQLRVDGALAATDPSAPYSFDWDSTLVPDGSHALRSRAFDTASQATSSAPVTVTVDNPGGPDLTPPATLIKRPVAGATVKGTVRVAAQATDAVGVTRVEFYRDADLLGMATAAPYFVDWDTTRVPDGAYVLTSRAYDAADNAGDSAPVVVTVRNNVVTTNLLFNGGFETGSFPPRWSASGPVAVVTEVFKAGSRAARIGTTTGFAGDAAVAQSFTVPTTGVTTLRFWVQLYCEFDSPPFAQQKARLLDPGGLPVATLFDTCAHQPAWSQQVVDLTPYAGQTLTLEFRTHDDGYPFDPVWFYVDAVSVKNVY